jgi:hypothetical protein
MFYAGGEFISIPDTKVSPTNVFIAIFAMMFGAMAAGNAS